MNSLKPKTNAILALAWEGWRSNRWCVLLLVGATLAVAGVRLLTGFVAGHGYLARPLSFDFATIAIPLLAPILFGVRAFAGERIRGTGPFLESLPSHRLRVAASKAALALLWLGIVDLFLWSFAVAPERILTDGRPPESYWLWLLSPQLILFGPCLLSSALNDRPLRAAFMAPVLFAALWAATAVMDFGLSLVLIDRSIRLPSASGVNWGKAFDLAPAVAGLVLLAAAHRVDRLAPRGKRRLALVCAIAASFLLLLLPAAQVFHMWGEQSTHFLKKWMPPRFGFVESVGDAGAMLLAVVCIASAVWVESRGWRDQGIPTAWAGVGAMTLASAIAVLLGWAAVMLGVPDWSSLVGSGYGSVPHFSPSPDGAQVLVVQKEQERFPPLPFRTPTVLLTSTGKRGLRIPCQMSSVPMWSPNGRCAAWNTVTGGILNPRTAVAVLDTKTRRLRLCRVPGYLPDYRVLAGWPSADHVWDLAWDPASDRIYHFSASETAGGPGTDGRLLECSVHAVSPERDSLKCSLLAKWQTAPSQVPWGLFPAGMDLGRDGEGLLLYTAPHPQSIGRVSSNVREERSSGIDATALYRIDLRTGAVTKDPALEALKREIRADGRTYTWLNYLRFFPNLKKRERPDLDLRRMVMVTRSGPSAAPAREYWSLGSSGSQNRRLAENLLSNKTPRVHLDRATYIEARSRETEDSDELEWDIVRSCSDTGTEQIFATCRAFVVFFDLSPHRRWLVVRAHRYGGSAINPRRGTTRLAATDGSFCGELEYLDPTLSSRGFWTPDDSAFLWTTQQGLGLTRLGSTTGPPSLLQQTPAGLRRLIGETGSPIGQPCVSGWTAYMAWDVTQARQYVLCRVDLQTEKGETILELADRGIRWVETGTFRLDDLDNE